MTIEQFAEVVWEDPPTRRGRPAADYAQALAPFVANPGRAGRLGKPFKTAGTAAAVATRLRKGEVDGVDPTKFEFTSRTTPDGGGAVWVRYLGDNGEIERQWTRTPRKSTSDGDGDGTTEPKPATKRSRTSAA